MDIVGTLSTNTSLTHLGISEPSDREFEQLLEIMKRNTTLTSLEVYFSTRKRECSGVFLATRRSIYPLLLLNRCGRGRIMDPNATLPDVLQVLGSVRPELDKAMPRPSQRRRSQRWSNETNALFGILRLTPSVWSKAKNARKRKAASLMTFPDNQNANKHGKVA